MLTTFARCFPTLAAPSTVGLQVALALGLCLAPTLLPSAQAQNQKLSAEVLKIDLAAKTVTLKAIMGHKTIRVFPPSLLDNVKVGDVVLITAGQDGTETVVVAMTVVKN